ncbi:MAG TPA: ATP-binding protein [Nocardioidaceae bacterium]|nr:ATP-binding protein [Nocardioidaceae bacterium]
MDHSSAWSHETVLDAEAISASRARDFVSFHLVEHHLRYLIDDVRLVVSELATNAVVHGRTPFIVTLQEDDDQVVLLTMQDGSASVPVRSAANGLDTSGRGLAIVEHVSRDWGVTPGPDGTKSVWAAFATTHTRETALQ